MAEIQQKPESGRRGRLLLIRLDMTPLVDLAFLLLSFFILTTTIRKEQAFELFLPQGGGKPAESITVLIAGRDGFYCYAGAFDADSTKLRRLGLDQVQVILNSVDSAHSPSWVFKPHSSAKYAGMIDLLDEFAAVHFTRFAIHDSLATGELLALEAVLEEGSDLYRTAAIGRADEQ